MATLDWKKFRKANAKATGNTVKFKSKLPCCTVTLLDTNISGYKLRLPVGFSGKINVKRGELDLQYGGNTWHSTYFEDYSRIVLSRGWTKFVKENDLKVGDVCGFELLPTTNVVTLRVTIFRTSGRVPSGCHQSVHRNFERPSISFQRPANSDTTDSGEFKPERPHFFKIILEDSEALQEYKLLIPRRFVRIYGHDMATYVQVKDPSGRKWKMEWAKSDGDTWFKNGWKEFAEYYSIVHGHALFFQYEGNSQFSVVIIDKSATEIMYPVEETRANVQEIDVEETDEETETDGFFVGEKCKQRFNVRTEKFKVDEKGKAFEKAASFNSKNPFFSIVMQQSYIVPISARLFIPSAFYINFINKDEGDASLYSNGRRWNVKYLNGGSKGKNKNNEKILRPSFGTGWKAFAGENSVEVGDVCVFELIKRTKVAFQVHIYRANENSDPSPSTRKRKQDTHEKVANRKPKTRDVQLKEHKTIESVDGFSSKNPFFSVFMEPRFLNSPYLDIPMDFVEKHFNQEESEALLLVGTRAWTVQFCPPGRFCGGWYKFVQDNSLQNRNICIFELIDETNLVLKVHIFGLC